MCLFDQTNKMKFHWTQLETAMHFTNTTETLKYEVKVFREIEREPKGGKDTDENKKKMQ